MQQETLRAEVRTERGSAPSRRLRRDGRVPAIVYGRGLQATAVSVASHELQAVLRTEAGLNAIINLEVDGSSYITVARELQRHPVRGEISHLDFIQVSLDEPIEAEVALEFEGVPTGVKDEGGFIETINGTVNIMALPTQIPSQIVIDVSGVEMHQVLTVADLPAIEGVEYLDELDQPVMTVLPPTKEEEPEPEEELLEGEEAVAAAAAEEGEEEPSDED